MAYLWIGFIVLFGMVGGVIADETVDDYPLVDTLRQTPVRAFDPVRFAQEIYGFEGDLTLSDTNNYDLGTIKSFWASNSITLETFLIDAELRAIGDHSLIWVQVGAVMSDEHLSSVVREFDDKIYPESHALWGDVPELEAPIDILYAHNLGNNIAGYFAQRHTYPADVVGKSNERPMFFINLDVYRFHIPSTGATLGHEYQHIIRFYRKPYEDTWLNEGFSTFSEYYLGYDSTWRYVTPLLTYPATQLNTFGLSGGSRLANYSAGFLFVLYFYHQYGLDGIQILNEQPAGGLNGVAQALAILEPSRTLDQFFADWVVANHLFNHDLWGYGDAFPRYISRQPTQLSEPIMIEQPQYSAQYFRFPFKGQTQIQLDSIKYVPLIPTDAPSGNQMLYSNRGDTTSMTLTRTFDLKNVEQATLSFDVWYEIEEFWDYVYLLISTDGGETWDFLSTEQMVSDDPFGNNYSAGYTGYSDGWQRDQIVLDAYTGQTVMIRFQYITDDAVTEHGIAIDNITIPEIDYKTDLETDDGGWLLDGWVWMDNRLPQKMWVQAIFYDRNGDVLDVQRWLYPNDAPITLDYSTTAEQVTLVISPFAPVTTVPAHYHLSLVTE